VQAVEEETPEEESDRLWTLMSMGSHPVGWVWCSPGKPDRGPFPTREAAMKFSP